MVPTITSTIYTVLPNDKLERPSCATLCKKKCAMTRLRRNLDELERFGIELCDSSILIDNFSYDTNWMPCETIQCAKDGNHPAVKGIERVMHFLTNHMQIVTSPYGTLFHEIPGNESVAQLDDQNECHLSNGHLTILMSTSSTNESRMYE